MAQDQRFICLGLIGFLKRSYRKNLFLNECKQIMLLLDTVSDENNEYQVTNHFMLTKFSIKITHVSIWGSQSVL